MTTLKNISFLLLTAALAFFMSSCGANMYEQPKFEVNEQNQFFSNQSSNLQLLEGTVSRKFGLLDPSFLSGQDENGALTEVPFPVTKELLLRGQQRFNIYCAPCHNYMATGDGIIVQKGMPQPTSFHNPRLLDAPVGYFFGVMTNGFGRMYSFASRIPPEDRWAISAYIKTLQFSQNTSLDAIPAEFRDTLKGARE